MNRASIELMIGELDEVINNPSRRTGSSKKRTMFVAKNTNESQKPIKENEGSTPVIRKMSKKSTKLKLKTKK